MIEKSIYSVYVLLALLFIYGFCWFVMLATAKQYEKEYICKEAFRSYCDVGGTFDITCECRAQTTTTTQICEKVDGKLVCWEVN